MQILLGGLITLVVTVIVQIIVIPLVQRRTRRLERWEDALIELVDIHDVQMGAPLDRHSAAVIFLALEEEKLERGEPDSSQDKVDAARQELYDAWDAVGQLWHRFSWLQKRVYLVSRGAPHWTWMDRVTWAFDKELRALNPRPSKYRLPPDLEVHDASTRRLAELHDDVGEVIHGVGDTMRPPPTYPWRRWWILAKWHARRLTGTLNPAFPPFDFDAVRAQILEDLDRKKLEPSSTESSQSPRVPR